MYSQICTPPFCDGMSKGSQNPSSKGGGGEDRWNCANSMHNPRISSSTSTKICPWATWMVKTWSNIRQMSESFEVVGRGTLAPTTPDTSVVSVPVEEGGGGTTPDDAPLGRVGPTLKWAALCLRKVAPIGAIIWTGSPAGKSSRPRKLYLIQKSLEFTWCDLVTQNFELTWKVFTWVISPE